MPRDDRPGLTPPPDYRANGKSSLPFVGLIGDVLGDARNLFLDHGALLKSEMKREATMAGAAGAAVAVGAVVTAIGVLLLLIGSVYLLQHLTALQLWACFFINGGVFFLLGVTALFFGVRRMTSVNVVPERTLNSLKESVQCLVNLRS